MRLLIGTNNQGKIIEIKEVLEGLPVEIFSPKDLGITDSPKETGETFRENARQKAKYYHLQARMPVLADDSGIMVEALIHELGVHTRRWGAGPKASDLHWIEFFLERMRGESNKRARFVCELCFIDEEGGEHMFSGTCDGRITDELEADYLPGLPISACFKPDGFDRVFSALKIEEKNTISHRGKAANAFKVFFARQIQSALI